MKGSKQLNSVLVETVHSRKQTGTCMQQRSCTTLLLLMVVVAVDVAVAVAVAVVLVPPGVVVVVH